VPRLWTILLTCAPLFGQQYTISTLAGDLNYPMSVAVDSSNNVYVADWSGYIRKIWADNGSVTIVAGIGILGYSGDGGLAANAMIGKVALALDDTGNIYVADGDNNRIRRIDAATRIITTIAGTGAKTDTGDGGLAINAGLSRSVGLAVDRTGDIYVGTWSKIRKISAATGTIQTIAGQFKTSFGGDGGPAVDALFWAPKPSAIAPDGDIFIADFENSRVRLISAKTGIVNTFVGSGTCPTDGLFPVSTVCQGGFAGDGGPAAKAIVNYPSAAVLDTEGNLYIADTINHRVRRVDAKTGIIETIAGNGANGFSGDGGPALSAEISTPAGIAVDASGKVYFADENNNRIRVLTPAAEPSRLKPALRP
jgi:hypothetical protein